MINFLKNAALRLRKDEKGVTLVEYGIALTLAVGVGTAVLSQLSTDVQGKMTAASGILTAPAE